MTGKYGDVWLVVSRVDYLLASRTCMCVCILEQLGRSVVGTSKTG